MGIEITKVDTCTCPWCAPAPWTTTRGGFDVTPGGGGIEPVPVAPMPPAPPAAAFGTADWVTPPPPPGATDLDVQVAAPVPTTEPTTTPAADPPLPARAADPPLVGGRTDLQLVPVGTPFADVIGFTNPFLD